jgi:predicted transcriptional regulator
MPMNEQQEPVQLDEREHMSETIEQLMYFNFTGMEARTYISLLENPDANGYQLAKILNVSRATVLLVAQQPLPEGRDTAH